MIPKTVLIFVALTVFGNLCESDRILAIMPTPSYSHQIVFNPLWLKLNSRGHHITLFTTHPTKDSNLSNFRQVNWGFAYQLWHEKHNISDTITNYNANLLKAFKQYAEMMDDIFTQELEYPEVKQILNDKNEHFDLVFVELLTPIMVAFSKRFNCPFIGVSPMDVTNFVHEAMNNPISPALYPDFVSKFDDDMNFWERVMNTLHYLLGKLYFKYYFYPKMDHIVRKYFGEDTPTVEEIQRNASMLFLNINPIVHNVRPLMSNVLMIGGGTHFEKNTTLPSDIQKFLDEAKSGAIYFSLGTNAKSKDVFELKTKMFLEIFSELPYKVVWKFEDTSVTTNPNVMIRQWVPQQQILRHPNIKLFITQGGLQSTEEAIINGVPIIGMPVFLDQFPNVKRMVRKGMGIMLDYATIEKDILKNAINEVISNPKYKSVAVKLSGLLKEQPISGIDQAVWWTEYVLRHKGAKFLKHSEIPLYQYLLLDVAVAVFLLMSILIYVLSILLKVCIAFVRKQHGKVKIE